jgi:hypothetical protein
LSIFVALSATAGRAAPPSPDYNVTSLETTDWDSSGPLQGDSEQSVANVDLLAMQLEVTQGIQNLHNSVRLVANKRTFVRFHVRSNSNSHWTTARLQVQRSGKPTIWLSPVSPPGAYRWVRSSPDRGVLHHAFLFELPDGYKSGNVSLLGHLNPHSSPAETDYWNNYASTAVSFESVPKINVVMYRIGYQVGGTYHLAPSSHSNQMISWVRRAYPVNQVSVWNRLDNWGTGTVDYKGRLTNPNCGAINSYLFSKKIWDLSYSSSSIPSGARYYGMVWDGGGFMRGCAMSIPAFVSSGPTGTDTWGWDFDGSYGDWYGGHELAHTYGRHHANYCGASGGGFYPYGGRISPWLTGNSAFYGFDISTRDVYGPNWKDVMTYCANQWISPFNYTGLMNFFQANTTPLSTAPRNDEPMDRLLVTGWIDPQTREAELNPLFIIPQADEVVERTPGDYAIVLRDRMGNELARYPFTPYENEGGPMDQPISDAERHVDLLVITELVPHVPGTTIVEVEDATGLLAVLSAGLTVPSVNVLEPRSGYSLDGDTITVLWEASDPDGDPLWFNIQYSPDNGQSWEMVAQHISGAEAEVGAPGSTGGLYQVEIDATNIVAGQEALFRVWATDGINTSNAEVDGPFTVPNRVPEVEILQPESGFTLAMTQTLTLEGYAYDIDTGFMADEQLTWSSNLDGMLGNGASLSLPQLSQGTHTITFVADDGEGGVASDTVQVTVVATVEDLPPLPDKLMVGPEAIVLEPSVGLASALISVENQNGQQVIGWNVSTDVPWLTLSAVSGNTPGALTIHFHNIDLPEGRHNAAITFSSPAVPGEQVTVQVQVFLSPAHLYLPIIMRP